MEEEEVTEVEIVNNMVTIPHYLITVGNLNDP